MKVWHDGLAVEWRRRGEFAGYLTTLQEAIDDPEPLETAARAITDWKRQYLGDPALRDFIERRIQEFS